MVPEERQRQGLFFNLSVRHNLVLPGKAIRGELVIRDAAESAEAAARWVGKDALRELTGPGVTRRLAARGLLSRGRRRA